MKQGKEEKNKTKQVKKEEKNKNKVSTWDAYVLINIHITLIPELYREK